MRIQRLRDGEEWCGRRLSPRRGRCQPPSAADNRVALVIRSDATELTKRWNPRIVRLGRGGRAIPLEPAECRHQAVPHFISAPLP